MSAEGLLFKIGEEMVSKVISLAADEITLAWGFKNEIERLEKNLRKLNLLICDASSNNKTQDGSVQEWLRELNEVAYKADAVLDEYSYETLRSKIENRKRDKLLSIFSVKKNSLLIRLRLAHSIRKVNVSLVECYAEGTRVKLVEKKATTVASNQRLDHPFIQESFVVGREDDIVKVVDMLCASYSDVDDDFLVMAIIGIGGQGKTTLVKMVCKHAEVLNNFDEIIWITVSEDFDVIKLLNEMIQSLTEENPQLTNIQAIIKKLSPKLQMKRYLLVLDDVWNEDGEKWSCFKSALLEIEAASGSRILTTTRNTGVASTMNTSRNHRLLQLSDEESWNIFKQRAFAQGGPEQTEALMRIGEEIVKKCQGLPLALKVIGSLMYSKKSENEWLLVQNSQLWNLDDNTNRVIQSLKLSYDHLSFPLKRCFCFCSLYPKDKEIDKNELIESWMALGLLQPRVGSGLKMEDVGDKYFNTLLSCSLLEDARKDELKAITICKMHDIVHDLALETVQTDYSILDSQALVSSRINSKHLRVLVFGAWRMFDFPDSIKKMKHLRYLDISETCISELPKFVTKLYNLQVLKINRLEWVHKDFANLINMKHLYVTHLIIRGSGKDSMSLKEMIRLLIINPTSLEIEELCIENCNEFLYLPDNLVNLQQKLELKSCGGLKKLQIESCSKLIGLPSLTEAFPVLRKLEIRNCHSMVEFPDMQYHTCLQELEILNLNKLTSVPNLCKSLQRLQIDLCDQLTSLPEKLGKALRVVEISNCSDLVCLPDFRYVQTLRLQRVGYSKGVDCFPWSSRSSSSDVLEEEEENDDIQCLQILDLWGWPELKSLSEQLQQLTALTSLILLDFDGLESLPDWLGTLSSLQYLQLWRCKKLKYLPSVEAMRRLTKLDQLLIYDCPLLKSRCIEDTRPEWKKISHIHYIRIDKDVIKDSLNSDTE